MSDEIKEVRRGIETALSNIKSATSLFEKDVADALKQDSTDLTLFRLGQAICLFMERQGQAMPRGTLPYISSVRARLGNERARARAEDQAARMASGQ